MRVVVIVLGDLGRSPRMQYHALALANERNDVDLVGYAGTPCCPAVESHPRIRIHRTPEMRMGGRVDTARFIFTLALIPRVGFQFLRLVWLLLRLERPNVVLVQNPPALPTLPLGILVARLRGARLVLDWHNFTYAMLALRLGKDHLVVRAARWYERVLGRHADAHLCVSRAMQAELRKGFGVANAVVLYDRPGPQFSPLDAGQRTAALRRFAAQLDWPALEQCAAATGRLALVVSPTSWTADEDVSLLLEALERYDREANVSLLVAITGTGPLREHYAHRIHTMRLGKVQIRTLWLEPADYPVFLASADLGLCLHRSSSGFDLPMKVADMFGAGVPVCALNYGTVLNEQITPGENGMLFDSVQDLAGVLQQLAGSADERRKLCAGARRAATAQGDRRKSVADIL